MKSILTKLKSILRFDNKKDPSLIDINPNRANLKKVVYWRLFSVIISTAVAYFYLHEIYNSIEMTVIEGIILTIVHYIFEELWDKND